MTRLLICLFVSFLVGCCPFLISSSVADEADGDENASATQSAAPVEKNSFHLYLLVGQSNMAGRGKVEPIDQMPDDRILMMDKSGDWQPAIDPLHFDKPKIIGVGLGRSFARSMLEPDVTIGLIPCAVGGSAISSWKPGGYHSETGAYPWDDMVPRLTQAMESGTLKGILWHQGESDSKAALAESYEQSLHDLISRLRKLAEDPTVPFLCGQMGQSPERPWSGFKQTVDAAHRSLPEQVPRTAFVLSDGLTLKPDQVHFDRAGCIEFGRRYADAFRKLER